MTWKPTTVATMIGVPQPTVEAVGQPTSTVVRCRPRRLTIAFEAGPRLSSSRLMTILTPTKPTPTVMPALKDLPIPMRKMSPTTKKMIGIITEAPRPMMVLMISIMFLSRARGRLLRPLLCVVAPHFPSASVFDEPCASTASS